MGHFQVRTQLDDHFQNEKSTLTYPYILVSEIGDEFNLVTTCLEEGDLPIIVKHDGVTIKLDRTISRSALTLKKLVGLYPLKIYISPTESYEIETILDLMEVIPWMQSSS